MRLCKPLLLIILSLFIAGQVAGESDSDNALVVGELWDIPSIDTSNDDGHVALNDKALVTETLVGANPDLSLKPVLALSWSQVDDLTWEVELRDDVFFHDGSKMTADEVKFSLERAVELDSKAASLLMLKSIEVVDPLTIRIHTTEPNAILPAALHYPSTAIISPRSLDDKGEFVSPIGTGAFMVESFDPKTHVLVVARNDKWWGGEVKLKKIILRPITDPNTRALALENGEVDFTVDVPYSETERIDSIEGLDVEKYSIPRIYLMDINLKHAPLDDILVRKAISYGIDRSSIAEYVLFDVGKPAVGPFMPDFYWTNKSLEEYKYDAQKARDLLADAGWTDSDGDGIVDKDGKSLELSLLTYPNRPGLPPMAEAIAGQLNEIGIKVQAEVLESGAISDRRKSGDWDLSLAAMSTAMVADPSYYLSFSYQTGGAFNNAGYSNSRVDELLEEASVTQDPEERLSMLNEVQSIVHDEVPIIDVAYYGVAVAKKDYVKGYQFDPTAHDYKLNPEMYLER
jgi:peptide/nickel transport system substrate-binding protein